MKDYLMKVKKIIIVAAVILAMLIIFGNSCTIVGPTEKGVIVTLGQVKETVDSGIHFKIPFASQIKKFDLTPIQYAKSLGIGTDGAVTADKQTIGIDYELWWKYDSAKIEEIARRFSNKDAVYEPISTALREIIKDEVGRISIAQFINDQSSVSEKVAKRLKERISYMPVEITQFSIVNLNWSNDYDEAIKNTARIAQQIEQAKNEAEVAAAEASKLVKQAEAKKQAAELDAEAAIAKARGDAEAKKLAADAQAYENQKIAQNLSTMSVQWKHDEQMKYYEKWNGELVPTYIPLTAAGGIVNLQNKEKF